MIKNIIFDIGGVVVIKGNFNRITKWLAQQIFGTLDPSFFKEYNINEDIKTEWEEWRLGKITMQEFFNKQRKKYHLKLSTHKLIYLLYHSQKPNRKVIRIIKKINKNYSVYALTNHTREWFNYQSKKYRYDSLFLGIVTSFDAKAAKPDIHIYKQLLKDYNLKPEECIFIDDVHENLIPAQQLKMKTILFESPQQLKQELKTHGLF